MFIFFSYYWTLYLYEKLYEKRFTKSELVSFLGKLKNMQSEFFCFDSIITVYWRSKEESGPVG